MEKVQIFGRYVRTSIYRQINDFPEDLVNVPLFPRVSQN